MTAHGAGGHPAGRIGPNAIVQTVAALRVRCGDHEAARALRESTGRTLDRLPDDLVDEREANALMAAVRARCGAAAPAVLRDAGERTAGYLLAHRVPALARRVLPRLPAPLALRLLLRAVGRHAWTFAGSGRFTWTAGRRAAATLRVASCPLCRGRAEPAPACGFYAATFERLLRTLVDDRLRVVEVECAATGGRDCRFVARRA